jgi:hypothetical protein
MPRLNYEDWNPRGDSQVVVTRANQVLENYRQQGITLTIRQLYYQFVSKNWLKNTERSYKKLIDMMSKARLAGLVDWDAIEDRTRNLQTISTWDSPSDIIHGAVRSYQRDLWANQENRIEVWIEKEALASVFETVCDTLRLDFMPCKGYMSLSEMHTAGRRLRDRRTHENQNAVILHFGDHDPSGMDMTRNIEERLRQFSQGPVDLIRCALNMDQIEQYEPPPNPAKVTDSRYQAYADEYGSESWELDALEPIVLRDLVTETVERYRDQEQWEADEAEETEEREQLQATSRYWPEVATFVDKLRQKEEG